MPNVKESIFIQQKCQVFLKEIKEEPASSADCAFLTSQDSDGNTKTDFATRNPKNSKEFERPFNLRERSK